MRTVKDLTYRFLLIAGMLGTIAVVELRPVGTASGQPPVVEDNWRFHDGRWSYWNQPDKRWYYTDGHHWYYHDGKVWAPYKFDRAFGRKFERGHYEVVAPGVNVTVPSHGVYVAP